MLVVLVPALPASAAPRASQATEVYVAIGSPAELEIIDSTSGQEVGSPIALSHTPTALAYWYRLRSQPTEVLVAEDNAFQEINPATGAATAPISLSAAPSAITVADVTSSQQYAIVLEPSVDEVQVIDLDNYDVAQTLSLGFSSGQPSGLAFNVNSDAYVTDPTSHQVKTLEYESTGGPFTVESTYTNSSLDPSSIVFDQAYDADFVSTGTDVDELSLSSGVVNSLVETIPISESGTSCTTSLDAGSLTLAGDGESGDLYVQESGSDAIGDISVSSDAMAACFTSSFTRGALAYSVDGGTLSVAAASSSALDLMGTSSGDVGTIENVVSLPGTPAAVTTAYNLTLDLEAYVAEQASNNVALVDLQGFVDETVSMPSGSDPDGVAVSPDNQYVYVADYGTNKVSIIQPDLMNTPTSALLSTSLSLPSGAEPDALAFSPDGDQLVVADYGIGKVTVIDVNASNPADDSVVGSVCVTTSCSTSADPDAIAFSRDGSHAYVALGDSDISELNPATSGSFSLVAQQGPFGSPVQGIAVAPNDQYAYATLAPSSGNGDLDVLRVNPSNGNLDRTSVRAVPVASDPGAVSLSPTGATGYVINKGSDSISIIDTCVSETTPCDDPSYPSVTSTVSVSGTASGLGVTPDGNSFVATGTSSTSPFSIYSAAEPSGSPTEANLGSNTSGSLAIAVAPLYNSPAGFSLAGYEDDTNPSIAASSQVGFEQGVDTASGSYTFNQDDLTLPDIGPSLDLSQEYDSADASVTGPLGYGWSFSYGMTLTQVAESASSGACDITVTQENGTPVTFFPPAWTGSSCPTGGYQPANWEQATLSTVPSCYDGDSCWDMTRGARTRYLFDSSTGDLVYIKDLNGNTVALAYSSGKLSTVTGESGVRQLTFTWSGSNLIEVEDSGGRTASFGYTGGNLTSLTLSATSTGDTTSHEWAFSYNSSHQLTDWWSPNNEAAYSGNASQATQIAYNSSGEVTSVTEPAWVAQCDGVSGTPYCQPETTFSYPSYDASTETGSVLVNDPNENYDSASGVNSGDGNITLDRYVDGVLTQQVKGYGYESSTTSPYDQSPMASDVTSSLPDPYVLEPVASIDGDGNITTDTYDGSGNLLRTVDPLGNITYSVFNNFDEVQQTLDPNGFASRAMYDSNGNELTSTNRDGDLTSYAYDSNGTMCAMLSPDGYAAGDTLTGCPSGSAPFVTAYGYDAEGDRTSVTEYDGTANTVSESYVTTSLYNAAGELCASLSADGYAAGDSLPGSCPTTGAAYETVNTAFDAFGNVLSSISPTNAPGGTTTTTYDADGNELTSTDPAGNVKTSAYDSDDQLCWSEPQSVPSPSCASPPTGGGSETTSYTYDPDGNKVASVAPDGNASTTLACLYTTTSTFDNLGNTLTRATPMGGTSCSNETPSTTTNTYDPDGNLLTSTDGTGTVTTSTYNADGELCWSDTAAPPNPTCVSPPTGSGTETTSYSYDADGKQTEMIPAVGNASGAPSDYAITTGYDENDDPITETVPSASGPGGETTTDHYDAGGNISSVTDPGGGTISYVYDEQSRELSATDQSGSEMQYTYDADGANLTTEAPDGNTSTTTYNGAGQATEIVYTDGTPTVSYQYAANGLRCWMYQGVSTASCSSPPSGATSYSYDSSSRLVAETNAAGATVTYGYDASSNLACVSYPNSAGNTCSSSGTPTGVVRYAYNGSNDVSSLTDWAGDTITFDYNSNGQACWVSTYAPSSPSCSSPPHQAGSVTTAYGYDDSLGNVSNIQTTTGTGPTNLLELAVDSWDADGNITGETPTVGTTAMTEDAYGYDQTEQVSSGPIIGSTGNTTYAYLPTGSITADTTAFQSAAYTADGEVCWTYSGSSSNGCSSPPSGASAYSFNSDGERTGSTPSSGNPESYGWDTGSGLLACANTDGTTCSTSSPTSTTTVYEYDGDGLRTSSTIGSATTAFTWGTVAGTANLLSDGSWDYLYANGSATPIEQIATTGSSPTVELLLSDESSNVRGIAQLSSGTHQDQLVNYTDYDAYGDPITGSGGSTETGGLTVPQTTLNPNYVGVTPWGFGDGYTDPTGLIYLLQGYDDAGTGQFLSAAQAHDNLEGAPYEYGANASPTQQTSPRHCNPTCPPPPPKGVPYPKAAETAAQDSYAAGFLDIRLLADIVAIAGAESGWDPTVTNTYEGVIYYGMWQIDIVDAHKSHICTSLTTSNYSQIRVNATCAYRYYQYFGDKFSAWNDPLVNPATGNMVSNYQTLTDGACQYKGDPSPKNDVCYNIAVSAADAAGYN
jgi:YD repeat-containing protein